MKFVQQYWILFFQFSLSGQFQNEVESSLLSGTVPTKNYLFTSLWLFSKALSEAEQRSDELYFAFGSTGQTNKFSVPNKNSDGADRGPIFQVCAHLTLHSAPQLTQVNFFQRMCLGSGEVNEYTLVYFL